MDPEHFESHSQVTDSHGGFVECTQPSNRKPSRSESKDPTCLYLFLIYVHTISKFNTQFQSFANTESNVQRSQFCKRWLHPSRSLASEMPAAAQVSKSSFDDPFHANLQDFMQLFCSTQLEGPGPCQVAGKSKASHWHLRPPPR